VVPLIALRVCIDVPDVDAAVAFYTGAFALTAIARDGFTELAGAPVPIDVLPRAQGMQTAGTERRYERHWTPVHLDFVVANVDDVVRRAVQLGARLEAGPSDQPFGRIAQLADPFGHGLCVLQMSARGYESARLE
jgi:predicted enzyme related to lactoylglutathione lyase